MRDPEAGWAEVARAREGPAHVTLRYVLPLAVLPAVAWMIGAAVFPQDIGGYAATLDARGIVLSGFWTLVGSLVAVPVLAAAIALVAPMYDRPRDLPGAFRVAGYGLTPLWLAGVLLVKPALVLALVIAALHACVLLHGGLRTVLAVRPADAAEYVAVTVFLASAASTLLGGTFSFLQIF